MALMQKGLSYLRKRRSVATLAGTISNLQSWFDSPYGQYILDEEQRILDQELSCLFGYHLMQLSIHRNVELFKNSRVCHCFSVGVGLPEEGVNVSAFSALDELPFEDESVDVTILHHVLDFSSNPHQVLREASRVTIPRGYVVIVGFNPISLMGCIKPFAQLLSKKPIWRSNSLRQARIADWLKFLDCNVVSAQTASHNLPLQNQRLMKAFLPFNRMAARWGLPFGNFYCLVARKDRTALTPVRPKWLSQSALAPRPKQALSARSAAKLAVIKGSKPSPGK